MSEYQQVIQSEAARIKQMKLATFRYYVRKGRGPAYEERGGVKLFRPEDVIEWEPAKKKRGPKKKSDHDQQ